MKFSQMQYQRVDFDQLKRDFAELERGLDAAKSGEEQFEIHKKFYEITGHVQTSMELSMIRHDIDTTPVFQNLVVSYQKKLYASRFRPYLEEKIGKVAFRNIELSMKAVDPKILPLMQEENALTTQYNDLLAKAQIPWRGETLNLSLMGPYLHSSDRAVRKEAYEAFTAFFTKNQEELDDLYDRLVKNRTHQGEAMGYENYLPLGYARMMRNCYDRSDIAQFRKQVKEDFVPFAEKLHERRRQRLGIDHLMYYDEGVYFPQGNPNELSPETAEFMNFMCDNELFDVIGRKTKTTGGYMTYIPDYKAPFIFANFNGTSGDADVITHECGHAFQGYIVREDPIREHADITMETAETHSMSARGRRITWICISKIRLRSFRTEPWWMSSRISRIRTRGFRRRPEMKHGAIWSVSISRIWIIQETAIMKKAVSGRSSIIFTIIRCTISTTALRRQTRCSTRYGWTEIIRKHGTVIFHCAVCPRPTSSSDLWKRRGSGIRSRTGASAI